MKSRAVVEPVFIVGPLRSGTTLLRLLLDHHPEMNFFGEFEASVSQANGDEWPDITSYQKFVETDRQTKALNLKVNSSLEYKDLVHDFLEQLHNRKPRYVLGASVHSRIDLLPKLWPQAKFINLLRDPRDVARSCIGMGWVGNVYEGAKYWLAVERHREKLSTIVSPEQMLTVRYEELVARPEAELRRICNFLSVEFCEEMLQIEKNTTYSAPSVKYAFQWQKKLSQNEIRWVEIQCDELMRKRGYDLYEKKNSPLGLLELIRIKLQNRLYRLKFNISKWGLPLYLAHVLSNRIGIDNWKRIVKEKTNKIDASLLK